MMDKLLTIVIPTYNAMAYLEKGLSSLWITQEELMQRLEVLIIDDGSPDDSYVIAEKFVKEKPEVYRLIRKKNGGHGSGINIGFQEATGKYVKVLDADDWVHAQGFASFVAQLDHIDADVIITPYQEFDITTKKITEKISRPEKYGQVYDLNAVMDQWQNIHPDMHFWGVTYRREFYQGLNYQVLEGVFYEDQEYASVPLSYAKTVVFLEDFVYVYRVGDVNQSVFGDTQVKRRSHLEAVLERLAAQEQLQDNMPPGGARYWKKKTAMAATSYYQIMLLKNKDKKMGRIAAKEMSNFLEKNCSSVFHMTKKKCDIFILLSYLPVTNKMYETWAPRLLGLMRKIRGQKV